MQLKSGMVVVTSINEDEAPDDNLIGTHEERVWESSGLLVELLLDDEYCSLGSIRFLACKFRRIFPQIFV